ncbi:hypothetical protein RvY_15038 [Ramazzottius varieornatus]|uniref:guanylate cyclase n=1 Tax=Ramazzottius varieornatus TaxID=947166 RepID=A0A1D1VTE7_RAMVA|nr:hypothetical protein RvY_15038 [Ramazzottius varieornatus]
MLRVVIWLPEHLYDKEGFDVYAESNEQILKMLGDFGRAPSARLIEPDENPSERFVHFSRTKIRGMWSTSSWLIQEEHVTFLNYGSYPVKDFFIPTHGPDIMVQCADILLNGTNAVAVTFFLNFPFTRVKRNPLAHLVIKIIKDMNHENLCKFHGLLWSRHLFDDNRMAYIADRPFKDTLRSVVDDENYALNWDLRFSLIWDLAQGLRYIHRSMLRFHGSITSLAVGIDPRFTLKICLVGVTPLCGLLLTQKDIDQYKPDITMKFYSLWLPPEVLLDAKEVADPRADSYSFGVLLYEITTRNSPFNIDFSDLTQLDSISVQMLEGTFEPIELIQGDLPEPVDQLIIDCLKRDRTQRPLVSAIIERLAVIYPQRAGMSFSDSLIDRMLRYHRELEEIVIEKTESLQAEARQVEAILHNLLPPSIVSILNRGEQVPLEHFDQVTVLFSDVPMVAELSGVITPIQLFGLLDDLCLVVDAILSTFNVFKVEAIKDQYMVVGGAPVRMGKRHVKEVAYLALKMMDGVKRLLVKDNCLTARIGMHSGPCVAGVVGTKLPHYTV